MALIVPLYSLFADDKKGNTFKLDRLVLAGTGNDAVNTPAGLQTSWVFNISRGRTSAIKTSLPTVIVDPSNSQYSVIYNTGTPALTEVVVISLFSSRFRLVG